MTRVVLTLAGPLSQMLLKQIFDIQNSEKHCLSISIFHSLSPSLSHLSPLSPLSLPVVSRSYLALSGQLATTKKCVCLF